MVYDVTMLEAFYAAYKRKGRTRTGYTETPFDVDRKDFVCSPV